MFGLMQDWPLTVDRIIDHAARWHGGKEVVSRSVEGPIVRTSYAALNERARRLSAALRQLGVAPGDRVATLAWNTARHVEAWYAIMGIGGICHTLNPRLFEEQLCAIIHHAQDSIIFTDLTFVPVLRERWDSLECVRHLIIMTGRDGMEGVNIPGALCYEDLIDQHAPDAGWGGFDENTAAGLCYTSGTTGDPKGVLYSHRSNFLHTLATIGPDVFGLSERETILAAVPMFHANAWGLGFSAPATGARLVMPGARLDGASLHELIESEGVTFSAGVPTVWHMLLDHLRATGGRLDTLKRVFVAGSALPEAMLRSYRDNYGVEMIHAWGMTELSPLGTAATMTAGVGNLAPDAQLAIRLKQGRPPLGIDLKLTDDGGKPLPHDGVSFGRLKVRGPFVTRQYYHEDAPLLDEDGFFDTGDVATIDAHGFMQITDRAKDVIKSGGEWISSIQIENIAIGHPKAALCAVIGMPHPRWGERPLLLVKPKPGEKPTEQEFLAFLENRVARWWLPDQIVFIEDIPLTATGKIDKKLIRAQLRGQSLPSLRDDSAGAH